MSRCWGSGSASFGFNGGFTGYIAPRAGGTPHSIIEGEVIGGSITPGANGAGRTSNTYILNDFY